MKKLQELKKIVYAELMENEEAIRSDTALIMGVCRRLGINTDESYAELALSGKLRQIENGSITRCRRKILEENPELVDKRITKIRNEQQQKYIDFSKVAGV